MPPWVVGNIDTHTDRQLLTVQRFMTNCAKNNKTCFPLKAYVALAYFHYIWLGNFNAVSEMFDLVSWEFEKRRAEALLFRHHRITWRRRKQAFKGLYIGEIKI